MVFFTGNDISDLAASPRGRDAIRSAVASYRQSMVQFAQGAEGALNGRSVIYSYANHCFHQSRLAYVPIESEQAKWEKDHLVYTVAKFADNLFSDVDRPADEQKQMDFAQMLKEKCLKVVLQNNCPTTAQLEEVKSRINDYLNGLLEKARAFEAASTSLSVPCQRAHTTNLSGSFSETTIIPDGWDKEFTTTFDSNAGLSVSTEPFTEEETSRLNFPNKNLLVLFLINVRKVILAMFNWFIDLFL